MNTIKFQGNGISVELRVPEIFQRDGKFYEPLAYRPIKRGDVYLSQEDYDLKLASGHSHYAFWIFRPIPRATKEQLQAIGMQERDNRPAELLPGDIIWVEGCKEPLEFCRYPCNGKYQRYGWVLVPVEKQVYGSKKFVIFNDKFRVICKTCGAEEVDLSADSAGGYRFEVSAVCSKCHEKYRYWDFEKKEGP